MSAVRSRWIRDVAFAFRTGGTHAADAPDVRRRKAGSSSGESRATASTGRVAKASVSASDDTGASHRTTSATCCEVG